ncbi:hypothetical protein I315_04655 [Cryptococcus gattii Ru294]|nr:hypothetical protein I315_04655 [Cryptococcus gattii Ru294]
MAGGKGKRMEVEASKYSKKALASWVVGICEVPGH